MKAMRTFAGALFLAVAGRQAPAVDMDGILQAGWSPYFVMVVLMAAIGIVLLLWSVLVRERGGIHDEITEYPAGKDIRPADRDILDTPVP